MIATGKDFWRGYWPLLLAIGAAQLTQQVDVLMNGRAGGAASGAYVLLMRLAIADLILMMATGVVASTTVARARRDGDASVAVAELLGTAAVAGLCCGAFGLFFYPRAARWLTGESDVARLVGEGVFWYSLAAPLRFFNNASAFALHALGRGGSVVRWKLAEVAAKAAMNVLLMEGLGLGFAGCFLSGLIIGALSAIWWRRLLFPSHARWIYLPGRARFRQLLRSTGWEAQRVAAIHLALLTCLALFAAPWLGNYDVSRLNSYAAGQAFMMILFAPFIAATQFLAFRLAELEGDQLDATVRMVWTQGVSLAGAAGLLLFVGCDWLGRAYGQHGPWWSTLMQALSLSLPLRFTTNMMRASLQSRGEFSTVAIIDSASFWLIATPLVATGLYVDSPHVTYLSQLIPEAAAATLLWRRLHRSTAADAMARQLSYSRPPGGS